MQTKAPPTGMVGLRHVSLFVQDVEKCLPFYVDLMGMRIEWQPDPDNYYLTNDGDVLAIHRVDETPQAQQRMDHLGFILDSVEAVDRWYEHFVSAGVKITEAPKLHRDGAKGFYCLDYVGHLVELIYHPPIIAHMNQKT